jgi:hypothetical protein
MRIYCGSVGSCSTAVVSFAVWFTKSVPSGCCVTSHKSSVLLLLLNVAVPMVWKISGCGCANGVEDQWMWMCQWCGRSVDVDVPMV